MREFKIFDLTMSIAAIVMTALLIYLVIFIMGWIIGIEKMESLEKFMSAFSGVIISLLIITGAALALAFLVMFVCWLCKVEEGIMILPFEVAAGDRMYSGKAISNLLISELLRIHKIHNTTYTEISVTFEIFKVPRLSSPSEDLTYSISQFGPVGLGTTSIHLGPLIAILKKLSFWGDSGQVISGSLQKYGSKASLVACMEHHNISAWEVSGIEDTNIANDDIIPCLVRDLAFKIVHDLSSKEISAKTWQGFKHFTEALNAYHQYKLIEDMDYLNISRIECLNAAKYEPKYEILQGLLFILGLAFTDKKEYIMAEELFLLATKIKTDYYLPMFGLGFLYDIQGKYNNSLKYYEKAIKIDPKDARAWYNKGIALSKLGRTKDAVEAYKKSIDLEPQKAEAWTNLGISYDILKCTEEAINAYQKAIEFNPDGSGPHITLARLYGNLGKEAESEEQCKLARKLIEKEREYNRACFEAICGRAETSLELLRTALKEKIVTAEYARRDPDFEFIRDDPRFEALLDEFSAGGEGGPK